jgi:ABC-type uncharacterized transport system ATPase subunit
VTDVLMEIRGLSKSYPGVVANDEVSFDIKQHEIHALLGENGAGKSTLVKMIYGLVRPDQGAMKLSGQAFAPGEPKVARSQGVGMVFQHFSLFDALNVGENIALGSAFEKFLRPMGCRLIQTASLAAYPQESASALKSSVACCKIRNC